MLMTYKMNNSFSQVEQGNSACHNMTIIIRSPGRVTCGTTVGTTGPYSTFT